MPPYWSAVSSTSRWEIFRDDTSPAKPYVLAERPGDARQESSSLILWDKAYFRDGDVSVRFKPVAGKRDRSGGLVWRYRDPNNYYVLDADAIRNTLVMFKVQNGNRIPLAPKSRRFAEPARMVPSDQWSVLHVKIRGSHYIVYFDHREVFEVNDSTFSGPGKTGLWTKADSVTYFADFQVKPK
jgi:hypothetical protein